MLRDGVGGGGSGNDVRPAGKLTREERRAKAALDEARKAGTAAPAVDAEGNLINPHLPEFMLKAPWYLNQAPDAGLKHQKANSANQKEVDPGMDTWYKRGEDAFVKETFAKNSALSSSSSSVPRKFVRGACKNCGATTHKEKNCMERPRKVGAWKTGKDLARDDVVQRLPICGDEPKGTKLSYAASRDRWAGFDADEHLKTVRLFSRAEEEKRKQVLKERDDKLRRKRKRKLARAVEKKAKTVAKEDGDDAAVESDSSSSSSSDGDKEEDVLGVKQNEFEVGNAVKSTVPNLRVREDVAKYLRNLDENSAYFDPKTRSMRGNPNPEKDPTTANYAGDNYLRVTGDAVEMARTQIFAWQSSKRGEGDASHLQANPTELALMKKQFEERAGKLKKSRLKEMHERYGGEKHMAPPAERRRTAAEEEDSSTYVEYSADGRVIRGNEALAKQFRAGSNAVNKYPENIFEGNHIAVWGSYFDRSAMAWGFACCHQLNRKAYCTGKAGKVAKFASDNIDLSNAQLPVSLTQCTDKTDSRHEEEMNTAIVSSAAIVSEVSEKMRIQAALDKLDADKNDDKKKKKKKKSKKHKKKSSRRDSSGSGSSDDAGSDGAEKAPNSKKTRYNVQKGDSGEVSKEEMEAYQRSKVHADDPLANISSDVVLSMRSSAPTRPGA